MGRGELRLLIAAAVSLAALALAGSAAASTSCSSRVLADWRDGGIDRKHPVYCYRQALESLPEDVRVYSTAEDDIVRALQAELRGPSAPAAAKPTGGDGDGDSLPFLVLALTGGFVLAAGSLAVIVR
jgi:hypothetical protein